MAIEQLLVLGLDGAESTVVEALVADGRMPNLARLRRVGATARLAPLPGLADDASWTTLASGRPPGQHGRFHHAQQVAGTYDVRQVRREDVAAHAFWSGLAAAGLRVAAIDVPKAPLAGGSVTLEVTDWMPHGPPSPTPLVTPSSHPLAQQIVPMTSACEPRHRGAVDEATHAATIRRHGQIRAAFLTQVASEDLDVLVAVASETHCAGHGFWHRHDPDHPEHEPGPDPVAEQYVAADALLGRLLDHVGPGAHVVVTAPIGMGPNHSAAHLLDQVLDQWNGSSGPASPPRALHRRLPRWIRRWTRRLAPATASAITAAAARRDVYRVPHDAVSAALRLNVRGREPWGRIDPGDVDAYCARLTTFLLALQDADTGHPVLDDVIRVSATHPGPASSDFADLLLVWNTDRAVTGVRGPGLAEVRGRATRRTGNHRQGGWITIAGPAIVPSVVPPTMELVDVAPTLAGLVGVELTGVEGVAAALASGPREATA